MNPKITLELFRYDPDEGGNGGFQSYVVPLREDWVILDAINHIKDHIDGSITYRWSCRMGVCGSCGLMVNGEARLGCAVYLKDYAPGPIRIEPLANFPVEKDLVVSVDPFMEKLESVKPYIVRKPGQEKSVEDGAYNQTPEQVLAYKQYTMCINCMLCYAACPVYGLEPDFVGPAALALAQRYNLDSRDQGKDLRSNIVGSHVGVWECTFIGECSEVCPKHVDPAQAVQRGKLFSTIDWFKSVLMPWGGAQ